MKVYDGVVEEKVCFFFEFIVVYIGDFNDNVLWFIKNGFVFWVNENENFNDVIFYVDVMDCDVGVNVKLRFFIILGNSDGYFDIKVDIGDIIVKCLFDLEGLVLLLLNYSLSKVIFYLFL